MNTTRIQRAADCSSVQLGWLSRLHSFSNEDSAFGSRGYALREMHEDRVLPGQQFPAQLLRNCERLTWVLDGKLDYSDSEGVSVQLGVGAVQLVSAGAGLRITEANASRDRGLHLLQMVFDANTRLAPPRHALITRAAAGTDTAFQLLASACGRNQSMLLRQDANVYGASIAPGERVVPPQAGRHYHLQVIRGDLDVNGEYLSAGDGMQLSARHPIVMTGLGCRAECIWIEWLTP